MPRIPKSFDLVFEGGGAKGTVFVGAMQVFEERGLKTRRLVGTSAGAISSTLLAAGYSAAEIKELAEERVGGKPVFATFMDIPERGSFSDAAIKKSLSQRILNKMDIPRIVKPWVSRKLIAGMMRSEAYRELFSFIELGGLYAGELFRKWIVAKLNAKKRGLGNRTLREFFQQTKKDMSVVAGDTEGREMLVLNHRTAPDCPVSWAVRMSMSIPFIWQEVRWRRSWGAYCKRDITGHTIVDGGLLSNFPLDLVATRSKFAKAVMGPTDPKGAGTIGLLIDETRPVPNSGSIANEGADTSGGGIMSDPGRLKTVKRIMRLINTMTEAHDKQFMATHKKLICHLPAKGYGTTEFNMSPERMNALIKAGRNAMTRYLKREYGS